MSLWTGKNDIIGGRASMFWASRCWSWFLGLLPLLHSAPISTVVSAMFCGFTRNACIFLDDSPDNLCATHFSTILSLNNSTLILMKVVQACSTKHMRNRNYGRHRCRAHSEKLTLSRASHCDKPLNQITLRGVIQAGKTMVRTTYCRSRAKLFRFRD